MALLCLPNYFIQYIIVTEVSQAARVSPKTFTLALCADNGYKMVMKPKKLLRCSDSSFLGMDKVASSNAAVRWTVDRSLLDGIDTIRRAERSRGHKSAWQLPQSVSHWQLTGVNRKGVRLSALPGGCGLHGYF
jgi:hypothetical protein